MLKVVIYVYFGPPSTLGCQKNNLGTNSGHPVPKSWLRPCSQVLCMCHYDLASEITIKNQGLIIAQLGLMFKFSQAGRSILPCLRVEICGYHLMCLAQPGVLYDWSESHISPYDSSFVFCQPIRHTVRLQGLLLKTHSCLAVSGNVRRGNGSDGLSRNCSFSGFHEIYVIWIFDTFENNF